MSVRLGITSKGDLDPRGVVIPQELRSYGAGILITFYRKIWQYENVQLAL